MRIEELSVGDFIFFTDGDCVVSVQEIYSDAQLLVSDGDSISEPVHITHLIPIPITPEILKKNGLEYEYDGNDAIIFLCCDMFWARLCVGDTFWQVGIHSEDRLDAVVCNVNYTHQLQHALRLAGVGKEIVV